MGVDYSTTVGFGITIADDKLPDALKAIADGEWVGEEHVVPWLGDNGFNEIAYDKIGNQMSGPTYIFFHLPRTHVYNGDYGDGVRKFENIELTWQEFFEFRKLQELLDIDESPEWIVSFNVS